MAFDSEFITKVRTESQAFHQAPAIGRSPVYVPGLQPSTLGDPGFLNFYQIRAAYMGGAMANGIASVALVKALAEAGYLAAFGAAGLSLERIAESILELKAGLGRRTFGVNLIHTPQDPAWEDALVDLLLREQVPMVEASAFLDLTLPLVRYRLKGAYRDQDGRVRSPQRLMAKVSRVELAQKFMSPAPAKLVAALVAAGHITEQEAAYSAELPMADDITAEADSGGHTDNRPALTVLPSFLALRQQLQDRYAWAESVRIGLAGGLGSPEALAAGFAMGAAYVVVGSVHQSCVEAGTSDQVKAMLCQAGQADFAMAPAADMFEMGIDVQVLKRGTMFPMKARKLYQIYRECRGGVEDLSAAQCDLLEKQYFRTSIAQQWQQTQAFFRQRDPSQLVKAERDPRHKLALLLRAYLGQASNWANQGVAARQIDYQVWCGPAMGAFNQWVAGSFLEQAPARQVAVVAQALLHGAALCLRLQALRAQGVFMTAEEVPLSPALPGEGREGLLESGAYANEGYCG